MKKTIVLLLALALLMSLAFTATAATSGQLQDGDNEIELPWDSTGPSTYTYTATRSGTLYVAATAFGSCRKGNDYTDNSEHMNEWEMDTVLTINGQRLENHYYGTIQVEKGETYTFVWEFTYQGYYGYNATLNLCYTNENMPKQGTEKIPVKLHRDDCPTGTIQISPGETAYYTLYEFADTCLCVSGEKAYVTITEFDVDAYEYITNRYDAVDGVAVAPIASDYVTIQIGNDGDAPAIFGLTWYYPVGSSRNPQQLVEGENIAITETDNYDGYFFTWTALCYGKLTLTFPETGWMYSIHNTTSGEKIEQSIYGQEGVQNPVTVDVSRGDVIVINVNSYNNATLSVPGGEVVFTATSEFGHFYGDPVVSEQPENCQGVGTRTQKCKLCKYEYVETFTGPHSAEHFPDGKEATCGEAGLLPHWYCAACDSYFTDEALTQEVTKEELSIPALEHSYAVTGTAAGTCTNMSTTTYTCEACGHSYVEEGSLDENNHQNIQLVNEVAVTCLADGYTGDQACADCGMLLSQGTVVKATGHSFGEWTTTEDGRYSTRVCQTCGHEETEDHGCQHTKTELTGAAEATCTTAGYTGDTCCIYCGQVMEKGASIPALGHAYVVTGTTDGTCVIKRTTTYTCEICGHSYVDEGTVDDSNHQNTRTINEVAATCLIDGYTGDLVCDDCGALLRQGTAITASGHSFGQWNTTQDGRYRSRTCQTCGHKETEDLGCQHAKTELTGAVEATCTTAGYTGDTCCSDCGKVMESGSGIPALGHSYECTATTPGTCVDKSTSTFTCSVCAYSYTETGSLDAENHGETEIKNAISATCTAEGYTGDQVCADCGALLAAGEKIGMLEHSFGDWTTSDDGSYTVRTCADCGYQEMKNLQCQHAVTDTIDKVEPTCTADGYTGDVVCMACGQILTEGTAIPATGHSFGDWTVTKEPTATEAGSRMRQCAACGQQETEEIPATGEPATEPTEPPTTQATQPTVPGSEPTEPTAQPTQPTQPGGEQNDGGSAGIVIAIVVAVLVIGGGAAVVLLKKKK